jgi:hypothetical protein
MHERPWVAGLASCVLHLGVAGVASIALLRPPEFGMESGTGGAGGVRSEREISAEVELEVMSPKENVVETVMESEPLPVEPEAEIVIKHLRCRLAAVVPVGFRGLPGEEDRQRIADAVVFRPSLSRGF